jgi:hypothetical protein
MQLRSGFHVGGVTWKREEGKKAKQEVDTMEILAKTSRERPEA